MKGPRLAVLALLVAVFAVSGCGGSKSSTTVASSTPKSTTSEPSGSALTTAQLIARADAICYGVNAKRAAVTITSSAALAQDLPRVAGYEQAGLTELEKLVPPASMAGDWKLILAHTRSIEEDTAKLTAYVHTDPHLLKGRPVLLKLQKANQELDAIARRDNFKDCAQNT